MSKLFKYKQYHYNWYDKKELSFPDDAVVFLTDADTPPSGLLMDVVIRTKEKPDHSPAYQIGDCWYLFMSGISIVETPLPIRNIDECEPPRDCYIVFRKERKTTWEELAIGQCDHKQLLEKLFVTTGISRVRRFTARGIEVCHIQIKDLAMNDHVEVSIRNWEYQYTWGWSYSCKSGNFFTTEPKYKRLFIDTLNRYYKLFNE